MNRNMTLPTRNDFGSKAYCKKAEVGKWYKFDGIIGNVIGYGKIVSFIDDDRVEVEKYFELPSYRPYAAHNWYDDLPFAIK